MSVPFNKEIIAEAIKEVLSEDQKIPVRVSSKSDPSDTGSIEVMDKDKMNALKRTGKVEIDPVEEDHHENPSDDSDMAKSQLYAIAKYAMELLQMIKDGQPLDAWVQAKITKASDYIDAVQHYLEGEEFLDSEESELTDDQLQELFGRVKDKTINYKGHVYKIIDVDKAGTFTLIDPEDPSAKAFYVNQAQMKQGEVKPVEDDTEEIPISDLMEAKATCCGKCGRVHVKGTECKKPYLTGKDHCRYN
jgi:hypothetical protein